MKSFAQLNQFIQYNRSAFSQATVNKQPKATYVSDINPLSLSNQHTVKANLSVQNFGQFSTLKINYSDKNSVVGSAWIQLLPHFSETISLEINPVFRKTELRQLTDLLGFQLGRLIYPNSKKMALESVMTAIPSHYKAGYRFTKLSKEEIPLGKTLVKQLEAGRMLSPEYLLMHSPTMPRMRLSLRVINMYKQLPSLLSVALQNAVKKV